jgi:carboxyl-terminal processing protease
MIRGKRGTKVQLRVLPATKGEPVVLDLTRQTVQLKDQEARADIVEQGKKSDGSPYRVGVIDLPSFYADTGAGKAEVKSAPRTSARSSRSSPARVWTAWFSTCAATAAGC